MASQRHAPASGAEIRRILGVIEDDEVVASVRGTGASAAEVLQALSWLNNDGDSSGRATLHGNAGRVFHILEQAREAACDGMGGDRPRESRPV